MGLVSKVTVAQLGVVGDQRCFPYLSIFSLPFKSFLYFILFHFPIKLETFLYIRGIPDVPPQFSTLETERSASRNTLAPTGVINQSFIIQLVQSHLKNSASCKPGCRFLISELRTSPTSPLP